MKDSWEDHLVLEQCGEAVGGVPPSRLGLAEVLENGEDLDTLPAAGADQARQRM